MTVNVSTLSALITTLKSAAPGDTITLSPGYYGVLEIDNFKFGSPGVTIKPQTGGVSCSQLVMGGCSWVNIAGIECYRQDGGWDGVVYISNCANVSLDSMKIHSKPVALNAYVNLAVMIRSCTGCSITNSELYECTSILDLYESNTCKVQSNYVHDFETDGILCAGSSNNTIGRNRITNAFPTIGDHPDAIQLFATAAFPNPSGNVIGNNVIKQGSGLKMQGIFCEDQSNLIITTNAMAGTMYNGISISRCKVALIKNNFVEGFTDMGSRIIIRGTSDSVTVTNNTCTENVVNYSDPGEPISTNVLITGTTLIPPAAPGDYRAQDAWVATNIPVVSPPPPVSPPPVSPPPVSPPPVSPPPTVDPRDTRIAALKTALQDIAVAIQKALLI